MEFRRFWNLQSNCLAKQRWWLATEMYMTRNYCALYKKAAEENETYKDKAAEWEQKLKEICENPAFPAQNARYGEYFQNSVR